jgi:hypothetical protein
MPEIIADKDEPEWKIAGHVIHVQGDGSDSAKYAGVKFDCYEISSRCKDALSPSVITNVFGTITISSVTGVSNRAGRRPQRSYTLTAAISNFS